MKGVEEKKSRKTARTGRGKANVISTGHKTPPKAIWIKRSGSTAANEQKGAKKPRVNNPGEGVKITEVIQEKEETVQECNTLIINEMKEKKATTNTEKAEFGDDQLRPEKGAL